MMICKKVIDKFGNIEYFNENGQYHREDGPAKEYPYVKCWFKNGKRHRIDGPAIEYFGPGIRKNEKHWYLDGLKHRSDGPAYQDSYGKKEWYVYGVKLTDEVMSWIRVNEMAINIDDWTLEQKILFKLVWG